MHWQYSWTWWMKSSPFLDKCVMVIIDDILVYAKYKEDHIEHLKIVLETLERVKFFVKLNKCEFWLDSVSFLGHIILGDEIFVASKIFAVKDWPIPMSISMIQSFLGLTRNYWRFIRNFSMIIGSLTKLLKKGEKYECIEDCDVVVEELSESSH